MSDTLPGINYVTGRCLTCGNPLRGLSVRNAFFCSYDCHNNYRDILPTRLHKRLECDRILRTRHHDKLDAMKAQHGINRGYKVAFDWLWQKLHPEEPLSQKQVGKDGPVRITRRAG